MESGQPSALPAAWVVPGPLRQVTGGYLYDARIVDGLRARGWRVGVVDVGVTGWPLDLAAGRRLTGALARERWGAVVVDELAHPALAAALLTGRLRAALGSTPLVLLVHHLRCSEPARWLPRRVARMVEGVAVRAADLAVCTSETTAQIVRSLARTGVSVRVVRPGWDTHGRAAPSPTPPPCEGEGEQASRLPLSRKRERGLGGEGSLRLLLVGHWTPRKGILDALAALERAPGGVSLDLVGEQDRDLAYAARVRTALVRPALSDRVRVHGRVTDERLHCLYAAADALILPSTYEGYGMVLAEALAAGLPIVATRVGAVPEVVRDGMEADLVDPGDIRGLARAIARLADDPAERSRRAALARGRAGGLPSWRQSIDTFASILREVVEGPDCVGSASSSNPSGRG